jgi:hypothetical protein
MSFLNVLVLEHQARSIARRRLRSVRGADTEGRMVLIGARADGFRVRTY